MKLSSFAIRMVLWYGVAITQESLSGSAVSHPTATDRQGVVTELTGRTLRGRFTFFSGSRLEFRENAGETLIIHDAPALQNLTPEPGRLLLEPMQIVFRADGAIEATVVRQNLST